MTAALSLFMITFTWGLCNAHAQSTPDGVVYQVHRPVDLGESEIAPPKDLYVSIGQSQGVKKGSYLDVYRKISSYDNMTQKLRGDHLVPVARVKVIFSDDKNSIARLDQVVSLQNEPALIPQGVMMGDVVRKSER